MVLPEVPKKFRGGGVATQKNRTLPQISNLGMFFLFFSFFLVFFRFKCVIRQFVASQDLIVDMIFEWLEFLVEVQTEKNRKSTTKNPKKTEKYRKKPKKPKNTEKKTEKTERYRKFQIRDWVFSVFSVFFGLQPPPI